jgi:hypothetical protein
MPPSAELVGNKGYDSDDLRAWLAPRAEPKPSSHPNAIERSNSNAILPSTGSVTLLNACSAASKTGDGSLRAMTATSNLHGNHRHCRYRYLVAQLSPDPRSQASHCAANMQESESNLFKGVFLW